LRGEIEKEGGAVVIEAFRVGHNTDQGMLGNARDTHRIHRPFRLYPRFLLFFLLCTLLWLRRPGAFHGVCWPIWRVGGVFSGTVALQKWEGAHAQSTKKMTNPPPLSRRWGIVIVRGGGVFERRRLNVGEVPCW